ncbi:Ku protein [Streptomyces morookaense]|uniref:non-homologous end joining protein Ku n=1 Tax=Streptomyces morookaense TaxID=1970 RepID=UPI0033C8B495
MARPIWSGALTFGLITVPVGLYSAVDEHTVRFHQLQRGTSDRIRNRRVNERTGKEVPAEKIVKGYEVDEGRYVLVEPEELDRIAPGRSRNLEVSGFVDLSDIEPVYFATTYYLAPRGKEYQKIYGLLRQALEQTGRAGIGTFVMRGRQYLTAVRAEPKVLVLHLMHWADEIRDPGRALPDLPDQRVGRGKELQSAVELIEALATDWDPGEYRDTYHEKVLELLRAKAEGEEVAEAPEPPPGTDVTDLMAALQQSIDEARSAGRGGAPRKRAGSRRTGLASLNKTELYERAAKAGVPGRSSMSREELIDALGGRKGSGRTKAA